MAKPLSASVGAFVLRTKGRAKRRRHSRRAGHGELSTIVSTVSESQEDEEAVPVVSSPDTCHGHEDEDDDESMDEVHLDGAGNRSALPDIPRPTMTDSAPNSPKRMLLKPSPNPSDAQDTSQKRQKLLNHFRAHTRKDENDHAISNVDSNSEAGTADPATVSPPQSGFSFHCAAPSSITTTSTRSLKKKRRRRKRSKGNRTLTSEESSNTEYPNIEQLSANEEPACHVSVLPTVSELTGKDWEVDEVNEQPAGSSAKSSCAAVTASSKNPNVETTIGAKGVPKVAQEDQSLLKLDAAKDWPAGLPMDRKPMQPALRDRMSRFFPRQSTGATSTSPSGRHSATFRHPRFRSKKVTTSPLAACNTSAGGKEAPVSNQDPSLEVLSPRPAQGGPKDIVSQIDLPSSTLDHSMDEAVSPSVKFPITPKASTPTKPLRALPWKWWRGTPRASFYAPPSSIPSYPDELVKPKSLEKLPVKQKADFVPASEGEWEFVQAFGLRGGWGEDGGGDSDGEGDLWEEGSGEWVWRCGEGCRCMRRGSYA